jgi:hypothetical protein
MLCKACLFAKSSTHLLQHFLLSALPTPEPTPTPTPPYEPCDIDVDVICTTSDGSACSDLEYLPPQNPEQEACFVPVKYQVIVCNYGETDATVTGLPWALDVLGGNLLSMLSNNPIPAGVCATADVPEATISVCREGMLSFTVNVRADNPNGKECSDEDGYEIMIGAPPTFPPTPEPTPQPTPQPIPQPTPDPTLQPVPVPTNPPTE